MAGCLLLGGAGSAVLAVAACQGVFLVGAALLGVGAGAGYLLGYYYSVHGRWNRARNAGLFEAAIVTQSLVAGPMGGFLAAQFSRRAPYAVTAGLAILAAGAVAMWLRGLQGTREKAGAPKGERR
jgi:MFS family permease